MTKSVIYYNNDWWGCAWYRCYVPGVALRKVGYNTVMELNDMRWEDARDYDVLVLQRQYTKPANDLMDYAQSLGKKVVYELDDDIWSLATSNPSYPLWKKPDVQAGAARIISKADVVTTTTPYLAEIMRKFNKNVVVLPNMLPAEYWPDSGAKRQREDKVVIGWAGGSSHVEDLHVLDQTIHQILDKYPNAYFAYAGGRAKSFDAHPRITRLDVSDIINYPKVMQAFDIGLAPIVDTKFNRSKSDLKIIEFGRLGIPIVATNTEAYSNTIIPGESGFLCKNVKQWLKHLSRLVENPDLRYSMGQKAYEVASKRMIDDNIHLWEKAYGLER
jgi:glycosyltransferase involved in cell wall biosynthesis